MKKVIICGIREHVIQIGNKLKSCCQITGYTDIPSKMQEYSHFDGHKYKGWEEYCDSDYDYVIVTYNKENDIAASMEMFSKILDKIIIYDWFHDATIKDVITKFANSQVPIEQLIIGMSHSQVGIQSHHLRRNTFKFALPSMDLFCHLQVIKRCFERVPEKMKQVNRIVLELPYYIFNYDLSKSVRSVKKRLYYFRSFGDYHNYGKKAEEVNVIHQFENYLCCFEYGNPSEYINDSDCAVCKRGAKEIIFELMRQRTAFSDDARVWKKIRTETVNENKVIFSELIALLEQEIPNVKIVILVCPFNPIFRYKNFWHIKNMKKVYYESLNEYDIDILDHFTLYHICSAFNDHCHLKNAWACQYTEYLDNLLEEEK